MTEEQQRNGFSAVQERLNQIVDEVSAEDISLDDALKLYEEAVKLGLSACDLSEQDIEAHLAAEEARDGSGATAKPDSIVEVAEAEAAGQAAAQIVEAAESADSIDHADPAETPTA